MKIIKKMMVILAVIFVLTGCKSKDSETRVSEKILNFPPALAGTWIDANSIDGNSIWLVDFAADASLAAVKNYFMVAPIIVGEGGGYDMFEGGELRSVYILGDYSGNYDEPNRFLRLEVNIDKFEMKRPIGDLTGWMHDVFEGRISDDNKKWDVKWKNTTYINQFEKSSYEEMEFTLQKQE